MKTKVDNSYCWLAPEKLYVCGAVFLNPRKENKPNLIQVEDEIFGGKVSEIAITKSGDVVRLRMAEVDVYIDAVPKSMNVIFEMKSESEDQIDPTRHMLPLSEFIKNEDA